MPTLGEEGAGGLGLKSLCTTNGPIRFSLWQTPKRSFFRTMVTLVWGGGSKGGSYACPLF